MEKRIEWSIERTSISCHWFFQSASYLSHQILLVSALFVIIKDTLCNFLLLILLFQAHSSFLLKVKLSLFHRQRWFFVINYWILLRNSTTESTAVKDWSVIDLIKQRRVIFLFSHLSEHLLPFFFKNLFSLYHSFIN